MRYKVLAVLFTLAMLLAIVAVPAYNLCTGWRAVLEPAPRAATLVATQELAQQVITQSIGWQTDWLERGIPPDEWPVVLDSTEWEVLGITRVSACNNRPGYGRFYMRALSASGGFLGAVTVAFDTTPSEGVAYDHMNIWGITGTGQGNLGYLEWNHLRVPTRYRIYVEGVLLVDNIRTDLGNEYCKPPGAAPWTGNVPVNRPGIYSYLVILQYVGGS